MLKYIASVFIAIFLIGNPKLLATDFPSSKTTAVLYVPSQGSSSYSYGVFGHDIGYKRQNDDVEYARTKYAFNFTSIPSNATINSVTLNYTVNNEGNSTYHFKVTEIENLGSPQEIWEGISSGTVFFQDVSYSSGSRSSSALTNWVNSHKNNWGYLGAYSQDESHTDSYANIALTVAVDYSVPPSNVTITADNNFIASGGLNHGSMNIDQTPVTIPLTGYTFSKTVGQNLTLGAVSSQNDNQNHQMIWHTGAINQSDWKRNGVFKSYNQNYSFTVVSDDNGKTYMANLRKNYAISRNNQTEFSGTISNPNLWYIVEQNSGQINAPYTYTPGAITYNFAGWTDDFITFATRTITPTNNETYTPFINM